MDALLSTRGGIRAAGLRTGTGSWTEGRTRTRVRRPRLSLGRVPRRSIGRLVARFPDLALHGEVTCNGRLNPRGAAAVPIAA